MAIQASKVHPIQNLGPVDRVLRFGGGVLIVGSIVLFWEMKHAWLPLPVMVYATAIAIYPILTGLVGWDPFYALFNIRSCGDNGRNQCGTFPYQLRALMGRAPQYCDSDDERSLEACHDEPGERPHHRSWRVDQEPMLYPDDKTLDEYVKRHPGAVPTERQRGSSGKSGKAA